MQAGRRQQLPTTTAAAYHISLIIGVSYVCCFAAGSDRISTSYLATWLPLLPNIRAEIAVNCMVNHLNNFD
jgi:hypothetical protein